MGDHLAHRDVILYFLEFPTFQKMCTHWVFQALFCVFCILEVFVQIRLKDECFFSVLDRLEVILDAIKSSHI